LGAKGRVLTDLGRLEEALTAFEQALDLDPEDPWTLVDKSLALRLQDDYTGALKSLDEALALDPNNAWALTIKGEILSDIAEFQAALEVLDRAIRIDPRDALTLRKKGWALENLGPERAREAQQAYQAALDQKPGDPDDLWTRKGFANALRLRGKAEAAAVEYRWVVDEAKRRGTMDASIMSLIGWCHYCLGNYDEAIRLFIEAISLDSDIISAQFDVALSLMCSGRYELGLREYQRGLDLTDRKHVLRRRGLLYVALDDLREAITAQPDLKKVKEVREALKLLRMAFDKVKAPVADSGFI
jgi:tetratricopeptide (TPR) repeat protein